MSENYYAVIMAGGGGTRLWPLSRKTHPKQMLRLGGDHTLFQIAVNRLDELFPSERILVVTGMGQVQELQRQCPQLPEENFVIEPEPRGTASAIGLSAVALQARDPDAVMAVLTADHFMADDSLFRRILQSAAQVAKDGYLVTLGIHPTYPATGYGYIQRGDTLGEYGGFEAYRVLRFKEKPDRDLASELIKDGDHAWNSGMFIWRTTAVMDEFERQMPQLFSVLQEIKSAWGSPDQSQVMARVWSTIKPQTIDYGIMENARQVAIIPARGLGWNDVGSWKALFDVLPATMDGNIVNCEKYIGVDTRKSLVYVQNKQRLVVTIGVEDLVIVDTEDVLLICTKDQAQKVRQVIDEIKEKDQHEYL
jgi:mannose-1-phosphate guanylyltransferase